MARIEHLDPSTPLASQLEADGGPVILMNTFFVPRQSMDEFLEVWRQDAVVMKSSPGFISTQLHRGTGDSQLLVNVAVWESPQALADAHSNPRIRGNLRRIPEGVVAYPHVYRKVAVDGVCVA